MTPTRKAAVKKAPAKKAAAAKNAAVKRVATAKTAKTAKATKTASSKRAVKKSTSRAATTKQSVPAAPTPAPPPPPPPPGQAMPLTAPRRRWVRPALVGGIVVASIAAVAVSRSGGTASPAFDTRALQGSLASPSTTSGPLCPSNATPASDVSDVLARRFLPTPSGFTQEADSSRPNGPFSVTDAVAQSANPPLAENALKNRGFMGGYRRVWEDRTDGLELHVVLGQFACLEGSVDDAKVNESAEAVGLQSPTEFPIPGIPSGWGAVAGTADKNGAYQQAIVAAAGSVEMRVYLFSAKPLDQGRVTALAEAQYQTLLARD